MTAGAVGLAEGESVCRDVCVMAVAVVILSACSSSGSSSADSRCDEAVEAAKVHYSTAERLDTQIKHNPPRHPERTSEPIPAGEPGWLGDATMRAMGGQVDDEALRKLVDERKAETDVWAQVVTKFPDCFSVEQVATAGSVLDD